MFARRDLVAIREATEAYARLVVPRTAVGAEELRRGKFMEGDRMLAFRDGREPLRDLAVERAALEAALGAAPQSGANLLPLEKHVGDGEHDDDRGNQAGDVRPDQDKALAEGKRRAE